MGGFVVVNEPRPERAETLWRRMLESMSLQGFARPITLRAGATRVAFYGKLPGAGTGGPQFHRGGEGRAFGFAGTALVDGQHGEAAARAAFELFDGTPPDWRRFVGQFCALALSARGVELFLDREGIYKAYRREDGAAFSSSFLAVAATLDRARAKTQAVYEYLAQEATYGEDTVLEGVRLLRSPGCYRLDGEERFTSWPREVPDSVRRAPLREQVESVLEPLRAQFGAIQAAFGDRIDTALSGGYDSRLMLALLRDRGVDAAIHVYGAERSADVQVAKRIAAAEGFLLHHQDKSAVEPLPTEAFPEVVERNFLAFDGYPCAGIFEAGVDLSTRLERSRGGRLMLNGGGGEVFRNFFYLRDRPYRVREVLHSFYNRYDPAVFTAAFREADYLEALEQKVIDVLGVGGPTLNRVQVERIYPEFRCRFWMGRNNAVNNRLGFALTPFVDPMVLSAALAVPMGLKDHGRFEAEMIRVLSPALASYPSDYGHAFDVRPPPRRVLGDLTTLLRPPWLRRFTYRIGHRRPRPRGRYLGRDYLRKVIDPELPLMRRFLDPHRCNDPGTFQRACTLEYLFQRLGAR